MPTAIGVGGCRFVVDDQHQCGAQKRAGSSYCEEHHALCYVPAHSQAERQRLREIAKIGEIVGGRSHDHRDRSISPAFVGRLEAAQR